MPDIDPQDLAAFQQSPHAVDPRDAEAFAAQSTSAPADNRSALDKLIGAGGPRYQTFPERIARGLYSAAENAITAPGRAYQQGLTPDEEIKAAADTATLVGPLAPVASTARTVAAAAVPAAAERAGIDLPVAIATQSPIARLVGQAVSKFPGGGVLSKAIGTAAEQTGEAAARVAENLGGATPAEAGGAFREAIQSQFKPAAKSVVGKAYDRVGELVNPDALTPLESTQTAIADIAARRQASAQGPGRASQLVIDAATRPGGLTYGGIKDLRTSIGEMIDTGTFPEGMSQAELRQIYGALSNDLAMSVAGSGGREATTAFERANALARNVASLKDSLGKVLGPASRSDEGVAGALVRMAGQGGSADLQTLYRARNSVPASVWQDVASSAVSRLGKNRAGEFSPVKFASDFGALSPEGRNLLFSGTANVRPYLDALVEVGNAFKRAGKIANVSNTAPTSAVYNFLQHGGAVGAGLVAAAATGAAHLSLVEPMSAAATALGAYGIARVLATPATAASMARWSRAYLSFIRRPVPAATVELARKAKEFADTAASFGVSFTPQSLLRATVGSGSNLGRRADHAPENNPAQNPAQ